MPFYRLEIHHENDTVPITPAIIRPILVPLPDLPQPINRFNKILKDK